jgi:hypothetical protein
VDGGAGDGGADYGAEAATTAAYYYDQQQSYHQQQEAAPPMPPIPPPPAQQYYESAIAGGVGEEEAKARGGGGGGSREGYAAAAAGGGGGDDAAARIAEIRQRALVNRNSTEEDVLMLLEEVERLRGEKDELATWAEAADRGAADARVMWEQARAVAERCSEDARRAMEELEGSQAIQADLHASLESALERLQQVYGEAQEVGKGGKYA